MPAKFTKEQLIDKVKELARQYPNAVYQRPHSNKSACYYDKGKVENGPETEGCIFGHALRALDPEIVFPENPIGISNFLYILEVPRDPVFGEIQYNQDCGMNWRVAVESAF
jgi:hypothetical protein